MSLLEEDDEDVPDFAAELEDMQDDELRGQIEDLGGNLDQDDIPLVKPIGSSGKKQGPGIPKIKVQNF